MSGTDHMDSVDWFALQKEFAYPRDLFLQRIKEEIYRCNRRAQCFVWIDIPLRGFVYDGFRLLVPKSAPEKNSKILEIWRISVQTMLAKEHLGVVGQGKDSLWSLFVNQDLQFLETIKSKIKARLKEAGFSRDIPKSLNFNVYFYSGRSQSFLQEENRFIKKWNSELNFSKIKRISIEDVKEKTLRGLYVRFLKRAIDIAGSLFGIAIFSLVMFFCAVFVKRALWKWQYEQKKRGNEPSKDTSVLFRQVRVGRNGKLFKCYKFRTMYPGADKEKEKLKKQLDMENGGVDRGPTFKMDDDPRILKHGGTFLRKHSLDELPQFFNVLRGDMSLVGPRPPTPDEVKTYEAWHYIRLSVKPGLTCIWQTSGRNDVDFDEWMRLDNKYIRERSTLGDLNLKLKTVEVMLSGKGAS